MKRTLFVFIVLGALMASLVFYRNAARSKVEKAEAAEVLAAKFKFNFEPAMINEIVIKAGKDTVIMKKAEGRWRAENLFGGVGAENAAVEDFLTSLKNVTAEERSNDPGLLEDYRLSGDEAIQITVFRDAQPQEDLLLGFKATEKGTNFICRKGTSKVYASAEDILRYLGFGKDVVEKKLDVDQWLDKRVAEVDVQALEGLTIRQDGQVYVDVRKDPQTSFWSFAASYPFAIDAAKITNYIQMINGLRGMGIVPAETVQWNDRDWILSVKVKDKPELKLRRKYLPDGSFFVGQADKPYAVKIAVYHFSNLEHNDGSFFADNVLGLDEGRINDLRFNDLKSKKKEVVSRKAEPLSWTNQKGAAFDNDRMKALVDAIKNLRLMAVPLPSKKGGEVFSLGFRQDKVIRELRMREAVSFPDAAPCYPVSIDKDPNSYCLEDSQARHLQGVINALYQGK